MSNANIPGKVINLWALPDSRLLFEILRDNNPLLVRTQPVNTTAPGWIIISVSWNGSDTVISINRHTLLLATADDEPVVVTPMNHAPGAFLSLDSPDAPSACKRAVERRRKEYGIPRRDARDAAHRLKTDLEQIAELASAISSLRDLGAAVQSGRDHLLGHLATELRALLHWGNRNYNPLLFRLAGRAGLPLPIYAMPPQSDEPAILRSATYRGGTSLPSLSQVIPTQVLVDLQTWLDQNHFVLTEAAVTGDTTGQTQRRLSAREIIAGVATKLGSAHYDVDVPLDIDYLTKLRGRNGSEVKKLLLHTAAVVADLGEYVLAHARQISPSLGGES